MKKHKRYLIIQTGFLGDAILATALPEAIRVNEPEAELDLMIRSGNEAVFKDHPYFKRVWVWKKKANKWTNLIKLILRIREQKYDRIYNLHRHASTGLTTVFGGAKETIGFDKNPFSFCFTKKVPHDFSGFHETERCLRLYQNDRPETGNARLPRPAVYPPKESYRRMENDYGKKDFITITPGSIWFTKRYPPEKWVEFINCLPAFLTVYLTGSPDEFDYCERIRTKTQGPKVINLTGKISMLDSIALMNYAIMNYAGDSSATHMASAVNAPIATVFCSTAPRYGFFPLSDVSYSIENLEKLDCHPCGSHGRVKCPKGHFKCALNIDKKKLLQPLRDQSNLFTSK